MNSEQRSYKTREPLHRFNGGAGSLVVVALLCGTVQGCNKTKAVVEELNSRLPSGCSAPTDQDKGLFKIACTGSIEASERGEVAQNVGKVKETVEKVEKALKPACSALGKAGFAQIHVETKLTYLSDDFATFWSGNTEKCLLGGDHGNCRDGVSVDGNMCDTFKSE